MRARPRAPTIAVGPLSELDFRTGADVQNAQARLEARDVLDRGAADGGSELDPEAEPVVEEVFRAHRAVRREAERSLRALVEEVDGSRGHARVGHDGQIRAQ